MTRNVVFSQTDGGYLGSDFETFFSSVVTGAPGVFVGTLSTDAGIIADLVVEPGQDVTVAGDEALAEAPLWGSGSLTVQQRGQLWEDIAMSMEMVSSVEDLEKALSEPAAFLETLA